VIAANVGALAKGTATRNVQLAKLRPVRTYKTIKRPALVRSKMKCWKMMATQTQAMK
jgi:hypothetical protein